MYDTVHINVQIVKLNPIWIWLYLKEIDNFDKVKNLRNMRSLRKTFPIYAKYVAYAGLALLT